MKKIKAGIIGCGAISLAKHLPGLKTIGEAEIVAFCDIVGEKAQFAAKEYGTPDAKVYSDYMELLKDESIDTIHVCTPNRSHSFITIDALEAGKHVICEKPMAKTYAEAKLMMDASEKTGKLLTIGYQNRLTPQNLFLKASIEKGDLGEIYFAKAHAIRRRGIPNWGVFLNEEEQGGGPLIDIGTHALDLTLWFMDNYKPKIVVGSVFKKLATENKSPTLGSFNPSDYKVEDSAFGYIVMENGATVYLESSWALNMLDGNEAACTLCGTKGGADMRDGLRINCEVHDALAVIKPDPGSSGTSYFMSSSNNSKVDLEQRAFYDAVLYDKPLVIHPYQALVVSQILEAIYTSSKTGMPVLF